MGEKSDLKLLMEKTHEYVTLQERIKQLEGMVIDTKNEMYPCRLDDLYHELENLDSRMQSLHTEVEERVEDAEREINSVRDQLGDASITDQIKTTMRAFLKNALGLEVSFEDKRQT